MRDYRSNIQTRLQENRHLVPRLIHLATVDAADGHTWLGDNFDSALLYGTLMEAATYTKAEQDMVQLYNERYVQAIALLKNLGDGKQRMDAYRDGQVRVQVS